MKIKSGDFVEINGEDVWVCNCKDAPLNGMLSKKCMFCNMRRPTKRAPDARESGAKKVASKKVKVAKPARG